MHRFQIARHTASLVATLSCPAALWTQTVIKGTITGEGARPLSGAEILIEALGLQVSTGPSGAYSLSISNRGTVLLLVRAIGHAPLSRTISVSGSDTVTVDFQLTPNPQQLDSLVVEAKEPPRVSGTMAGFEERRNAGFGRFYTRDMLASREHSTLTDAIRMTAGLHLVRRPTICGGGFAAASARGSGSMEGQSWMTCVGGAPFPLACYMAVYLDGVRIWAPGSMEPPNLNQFSVVEFEGIEIYRGAAETPVQFLGTGSSCGAILLWTRTGEQ